MDSGTCRHRLLIVEGDAHVTELFAEVVRQRLGWEVTAVSGPDGVDQAVSGEARFDLALVGWSFRGQPQGRVPAGVQVMQRVWQHQPQVRFVVIDRPGDAAQVWADAVYVAGLPVVAVLRAQWSVDEQLEVLAGALQSADDRDIRRRAFH